MLIEYRINLDRSLEHIIKQLLETLLIFSVVSMQGRWDRKNRMQ